MSMCLFYTKARKEKEGVSQVGLMGIAFFLFFCPPPQEQTKVNNALCEQISVLCKMKQYRVV